MLKKILKKVLKSKSGYKRYSSSGYHKKGYHYGHKYYKKKRKSFFKSYSSS